ncbi:MAG TPA: hypothetical protein VMW23_10105 [Sedimentisphaerales bacterium]|nr:hypothetical protein [Sedimentisphaerales bacterium]
MSKEKLSCSQKVIISSAVLCMLGMCGCGDFFAEKATELQAQAILRDLSRIRTTPDPNYPVPDIYKQPPKIIETKKGMKLLYFTKHHPVEEFAGKGNAPGLIQQQFGYNVSKNPATNQLIVECPGREEVQTILDFLKHVDIPPIQVKIDCLVSELYADVTMDWETTIKIENFLGEKIGLGGKEVQVFNTAGDLVDTILKPAFPGASLRDEARELLGLKVGYSRNVGVSGHEFRALVDLLVSRGYLKILMNPVLEVVNGKTAHIEARDYVPLPKEVVRPEVEPYMTTEYQWVVDSLDITPHVFADGYIGLETSVQIGSKSTPEGVKQIPIITERKIQNKENRIRQGDSLIIGGIRKSEERSVIRGVPFLKDIPIIGILFSSKDYEDRAKEVIFIITPTISSGGIPYEEMVKKIEKKHVKPEYKYGIEELLTDPLGTGIYTEQVEQKAAEAEFERLKAELESAEARDDVSQVKVKFLEAVEKVIAEKQKAAAATRDARIAAQAAQRAQEQAEKIRAEAESSILESQAEKDKTKAYAVKLKEDALKVLEKAQEAQEKAKQAEERARKAEAELLKLKQQQQGSGGEK